MPMYVQAIWSASILTDPVGPASNTWDSNLDNDRQIEPVVSKSSSFITVCKTMSSASEIGNNKSVWFSNLFFLDQQFVFELTANGNISLHNIYPIRLCYILQRCWLIAAWNKKRICLINIEQITTGNSQNITKLIFMFFGGEPIAKNTFHFIVKCLREKYVFVKKTINICIVCNAYLLKKFFGIKSQAFD